MGSASSARSAKEDRFHATLYLTPAEVQQLQDRADSDLRSISNYLSKLVVDDLQRSQAERQKRTLEAVDRRDGQRSSYDAAIRLTAAARKKITARASKEMRAVGNYITTLVLGDLRKG